LAELHQRMSGAEFLAWLAHDRDHGLPDRRAEMQRAMVGAGQMNAHTKRVDGRPWRVGDFLPFQPSDLAEPASLGAQLVAAFAAHNARQENAPWPPA